MFDFDDGVSDKTNTSISFEYRRYNDRARLEAEVNNHLYNDEAEYLPHILDAFKQFLNGVGFTYVEEIVAVKGSGEETTSAEVLF